MGPQATARASHAPEPLGTRRGRRPRERRTRKGGRRRRAEGAGDGGDEPARPAAQDRGGEEDQGEPGGGLVWSDPMNRVTTNKALASGSCQPFASSLASASASAIITFRLLRAFQA